MKKTLLIGLGILIILIGGAYLAVRRSPQAVTDDASVATSTDTSASTSTPVTPGRGTVTVPESGTVTLALNETAAFRGFLITPTEVMQDSRCPAGVYCIQAGTLEVKVEINSGVVATSRVVKLGDSVVIGTEKITFSSVEPLKTTKPIDPKDYRFTVTVEKM